MRHINRLAITFVAFALFSLFSALGGNAQTYKVLWSFCSQSTCSDGGYPNYGVITDGAESLYGPTGIPDPGWGPKTAYKLSPTTSGWNETVLYNFGSAGSIGGPSSPLIMDGSGNLYGAFYNEGGSGTVYQLSQTGGNWTRTDLSAICCRPYTTLMMDAAGSIYGTTMLGGGFGLGEVFRLTPSATGWVQTTIWSFSQGGWEPVAAPVMDAAGNLFGTAARNNDSPDDAGVVYALMPAGNGFQYAELYAFCSQTNCADGRWPVFSLIMDGAGNLYGTTLFGGNQSCVPPFGSGWGCGVAFKLTPTAGGWRETVLHAFCSQANCADGAIPAGPLVMDAGGNLYGLATYGGANGGGTVFKLAPASTGYTETVLYNFCSQTDCADGNMPTSGALAIDKAGNLYGTTFIGGAANAGVAFQLSGVVTTQIFAGTPGNSTCQSATVTALVNQFGSVSAAAAALGHPSVKALQKAIQTYCQ